MEFRFFIPIFICGLFIVRGMLILRYFILGDNLKIQIPYIVAQNRIKDVLILIRHWSINLLIYYKIKSFLMIELCSEIKC